MIFYRSVNIIELAFRWYKVSNGRDILQRKVLWVKVQISREFKDKSHVYNTMKANVTFQTSYCVATRLL